MGTEKKAVNSKKTAGQELKESFEKTRTFIKEVMAELKKVQWPSRRQALGETLVVLIVVIFITCLIQFYDFILNILFSVVYQR